MKKELPAWRSRQANYRDERLQRCRKAGYICWVWSRHFYFIHLKDHAMETQPTLDGMIADSIRSALNSDAIKKRVENAADAAITEAIKDAFGYSSAFRKTIQDQIKSVLPTIEARELSTFAHAVRELLMRRLDTLASETARIHLGEVIEKILPDDPIITMEDFKKAFFEKIKTSNYDGCDCHGEDENSEPPCTWSIETSDTEGYWDLIYSEEEDAYRYGTKTHVMRFRALKDEPGLHQCWMLDDKEIVNKKNNGRTEMFSGPLYGFDLMVWRLASGTAKLKR